MQTKGYIQSDQCGQSEGTNEAIEICNDKGVKKTSKNSKKSTKISKIQAQENQIDLIIDIIETTESMCGNR